MTDYRKRMFRGAKIEDCIRDFIDMESCALEQIRNDETEFALFSKGMHTAYQFVVNRMVRDFEYNKEELNLKQKLSELEKMYRRLAETNLEQSKQDLFQTVEQSYYDVDVPEDALEELKELSPDYQKGMFEGMSFAYEDVANYISIIISNVENINDKSVNQLISLISSNNFVNKEIDLEEESKTYKSGFASGAKAGFKLTVVELKERFSVHV